MNKIFIIGMWMFLLVVVASGVKAMPSNPCADGSECWRGEECINHTCSPMSASCFFGAACPAGSTCNSSTGSCDGPGGAPFVPPPLPPMYSDWVCWSDADCPEHEVCYGNHTCSVTAPVPTDIPMTTGADGKCIESCENGVLIKCKTKEWEDPYWYVGCFTAGQTDTCLGVPVCCPSVNGLWTKDMSACKNGGIVGTSVGPGSPPNGGVVADANADGKVDLADFAVWKSEYLGTLSTKLSDINRDNKVDLADFQIWKTDYIN